MRRLLFVLIIVILNIGIATAGREGDREAYKLIEKAYSQILERRYSQAMKTLVKADAIEDMAEITRTQIAAAKSRAAMGEGDYMKASEFYRLARLHSPDEEADDMLRLIGSEIFFAIGDYEKSLAVTDSILSPAYMATKYAHRVRALTLLDRCDEAIELANKAFDEFAAGAYEAHPVLLQNRGYAYWESGNLEAAAADLEKAVSMITDATDRLNLTGNLAMVESELGRHASAIRHINEAVKGLSADTPDGQIARRKRAEILRNAGKNEESVKEFKNYFLKKREDLKDNLPEMSATERLNYWMREKSLLSRCFDTKSDAEFLYEVASFRRMTSLLGMRDYSELVPLLEVTPREIRKSLKKGEAAVEFITFEASKDKPAYAAIVLPYKGKVSFVKLFEEEDLFQAETIGLNSIYNAIQRQSSKDKNNLYSDTVSAEMVWRPVIDALPKDVKEIYFAPEGVLHLWGIENMPFEGRENYKLHRLTGTAMLAGRSSAKDAAGKSLIVGGLDYNRAEPSTIKGSGNSEAVELFENRGVRPLFGYLKGTRNEVDSIGRLLPGGEVAHDMNEALLKSVMPDYDVIHIATHGYSIGFGLKKRPEFLADSVAIDRSLLGSGLALSGANSGYNPVIGEDGLLSGREICDMNLEGVDLVILSACSTAVGDISDEGSTGLVRALKMAGVKTIIATLWEVDDMSTMLFMQTLHKALSEGDDKHTAYMKAQSRLKNEQVNVSYRPFSPGIMARQRTPETIVLPPFDKPFYWAPFILIDDI